MLLTPQHKNFNLIQDTHVTYIDDSRSKEQKFGQTYASTTQRHRDGLCCYCEKRDAVEQTCIIVEWASLTSIHFNRPSSHDCLHLLSCTSSMLVHKSLQNYCLHRFLLQSIASYNRNVSRGV